MAIKVPKPGLHAPRCPQCARKFQIRIDEGSDTPHISKLADDATEETLTPDIAAALGIELPKPVAKQSVARQVTASSAGATSAPAKGLRKSVDASSNGDSNAGMTAPPRAGTQLPDESMAGGSFAGEGAFGSDDDLPSLSRAPLDDVSSASSMPVSRAAPSDVGATSVPSRDVHATGVPSRDIGATSLPSDERAHQTSSPRTVPRTVDEDPAAPEPDLVGRTLGGFAVLQKIGSGGMGSVYLARQTSLDRNVAVKVLKPSLASDPALVSRFTREAYAAAQLVHHNVVQIYDIGEQQNVHFFGMEFVEGQTLSGVVKEHGKLDPEVAAGYTLQAARGLKFAHDHGMVHRDIKPDNLLLNDQGIVKVADLGLVKTGAEKTEAGGTNPNRSADQTGVGMSMGTPAYMAPEQALDAAKVDGRADIYSLGCTLFDLLTGRPPFTGRTAYEVITKHQNEAPPAIERLNQRVPKSLVALVSRMMAKKPDDRFGTMGEVVRELEEFLGLDGSKPFSPREEHASILGICVSNFNNAKLANLRGKIIAGFFAVCAVAILVGFTLTSSPLGWGGGLVGFTLLTPLCYVVLSGITGRTHLFLKLRQLVFGARVFDWLTYILVIGAVVGALVLLDLHWIWLGFLVAAGLVAAGYHFSVDLLLSRKRKDPIERAEALFKQLRLKGLDEDSLRQFVAKFAGDRWEEFYETLFGYESKLRARSLWVRGEGAKKAKTFGAWRDPVVRWIEHTVEARKSAREQRHLAKVEAKKLKAEGVSDVEAKQKARKSAEKMVDKAAHLRDVSQQRSAMTAMPAVGRAVAKASGKFDPDSISVVRPGYMDDEPGGAEPERVRQSYIQRKYGGWHGLIVGPQTRFALGFILLLGFGVWLYQNKSVPLTQIIEKSADSIGKVHDTLSAEEKYRDPGVVVQAGQIKAPKKELEIKFVPKPVTAVFSTYNCGIAGALLVLSCLFPGTKLGWFIVPGALFMFAGHLIPGLPAASVVPGLSKIAQTTTLFPLTLAGGGILAVFGLVFARK